MSPPAHHAGSPPTILFLNHNFKSRSTYFRNFGFARELARHGWRPTLLTVNPEKFNFAPSESLDAVHVIQTPQGFVPKRFAESGCCPMDIVTRCALVLAKGYDVIVASDHLFDVSIPYFLARALDRSRLFVADWADLFTMGGLHESWNRPATRPLYDLDHFLERTVKQSAHVCTATSLRLCGKLQTLWGVEPGRILYLPSGCATPVPFQGEPRVARDRLGISGAGTWVGMTTSSGQLHPFERGQLENLGSRYRSLTGSRLGLVLVGPFQERPFENLHCHTTGRLKSEDVVPALEACDFFMLMEEDTPQNRSRGPIRLNSYLAAGRPVLCNSVGDHVPLLQKRGIAVVADDLATANPSVDALLMDTQRRAEMSKNARVLAEGDWSWDALGLQLHQFLTLHLAGKPNP